MKILGIQIGKEAEEVIDPQVAFRARYERLRSMVGNVNCVVTNDPKWAGFVELEELKDKLK
ncbi:MAG: hypothetical protein HRU18_06715 [Pseudoalteromonas sp.]|uniref:hypothetical protein n=1 Tax=Pseudoalteromonas sp. TaxID=53249 RepID=UPI001DAAF4AB|nr:hypothetical protein [Pseudoalteromonas sp.]NRA77882.1 hypothetical protein [Pseudoalteromonas sp.]